MWSWKPVLLQVEQIRLAFLCLVEVFGTEVVTTYLTTCLWRLEWSGGEAAVNNKCLKMSSVSTTFIILEVF